MKRRPAIARRTMLRGLGVSMALPWLESIPAFADTPKPQNPKNLIFIKNSIK